MFHKILSPLTNTRNYSFELLTTQKRVAIQKVRKLASPQITRRIYTMSIPPRQSMIRQTRSKTRAAKESANPNLQVEMESLEENHSSNSFEPSIIDVYGGDKFECGGCDKPNNFELYMVQCRGCARWYHFSCANVKQSTVRREAFACKLCIPPASSRTSRTTTSSMRRARIARELERLDEERKLMERMHDEEFALQEKARKDKFEHEKQYLAKRFDLLRQQDEQDGTSNSGSSRRSQHSHQGSHQNRVQDWVDDVARVSEGAGEQVPITTVVVNEKDFDPNVIVTNEGHASSTPLKAPSCNAGIGLIPPPPPLPVPLRLNDKSRELIATPRTTGSIAIGETADEDSESVIGAVGGTNRPRISPVLSFVDVVGPLDDLLNNPVVTKSKTGTIPKLQTRPPFEQWSSRTINNEYEKERVKENDVRRQRELDLIDQLNRLEMQKEDGFLKNRELEQQMKTREQEQEQLVLHKQRELVKMEQQLQHQKQEKENFVRQQQKVLKERDEELERLRRLEQEYNQYRRTKEYQREDDRVTTLRPPLVHSAAVMSKAAEYRDRAEPPRHEDICGNPVSDALLGGTQPHSHDVRLQHRSFDEPGINTPVGGRSDIDVESRAFASQDSVRPSQIQNPVLNPYLPVSTPPVVNNVAIPPQLTPTPQQLAARQVVNRELPIFAGDPIDWPLFISSYNHSTHACGYSDSEILLRLQRCLKGSAKEAVSSFLLHPTKVPQVVSTLQLLYGRPEQIVQSLIAKVRNTPAPKSERLDTLVSFGLVVQNLCGHLKAIGLENHLSNPVLLNELVEKLPTAVKFNWALHQSQLAVVDLSAFGEYMANVVSATSCVVSWNGVASKVAKDDRSKGKDRAYINTHTPNRE
ncbi:uncharacterized protein LOC134285309 [Aedes albopictus]|uniref:PHD-type domain-containing protein n=1 Tax=Aedes albopictus TaxID=7160 RepID=A0ABM2A7Y5_AEDAL